MKVLTEMIGSIGLDPLSGVELYHTNGSRFRFGNTTRSNFRVCLVPSSAIPPF